VVQALPADRADQTLHIVEMSGIGRRIQPVGATPSNLTR
jgi:hypothetical protein